ncbi:hypothetical protein TNCV_133101, partial [Trichonephila clavipes]
MVSCKILRPSAKLSTKSDSAFKKSKNTEELELIPASKIKIECIDISDDDEPAESTSEATSSSQAKSSCIAPAMLTYTEPTNSGATGGALEM